MPNLERQAARSRLWTFCKRVGIAPTLATLYWNIKLALHLWSASVSVGGYTAEFAADTRTEYQRVTSLIGERDVVKSLLEDVRESDVVYDIGANIGTHTCFVGKRLRDGVVIAFEPMPTNAAHLRQNLSMNVPAGRWVVAECALSNENGNGTLAVEGQSYGAGRHALSQHGELDIDVCRGETLIESERYPLPNIIKIDVEGAELKVLKGFGDLLSEVRVVYAELHHDLSIEYGTSTDEIEAYLCNYGFEIERLSERSDAYHIRAIKSQG
ncbi:FkbM family methyltransferase [Haladaptatus salinisoli]|uniref:FkbM family methyltransferase n=1 Tax=Haladaptatus salinisoli TaxID=2884876 RepID=UPI001D09E4CD|nr:FkbM family methyltransferase [Haladaptatus salinisoli]